MKDDDIPEVICGVSLKYLLPVTLKGGSTEPLEPPLATGMRPCKSLYLSDIDEQLVMDTEGFDYISKIHRKYHERSAVLAMF